MGKLIGYKVGKYARVYLSLLWIYVLNKFLGFFVDPEICPLDKVVWNYICIRLYQIIQALTRSLWDGQSCLKFVLGRSSMVLLQTWVPAVTNLLFNYYLLWQKKFCFISSWETTSWDELSEFPLPKFAHTNFGWEHLFESTHLLERNPQLENFISRNCLKAGNKWVPRQTLLVEKNPERLDAGDQHVDAQVELQPVDQQWPLQVSLHAQGTLFHGHVLEVIDHFYPHAAEEVGWFDDPEAVLGSPHRPPQEVALPWQDVGVGHILPFLLPELLPHSSIVLKQMIFVRTDVVHGWNRFWKQIVEFLLW